MNLTAILSLLQLVASLLGSTLSNPSATLAQKSLALSLAGQAVQIAQSYSAQESLKNVNVPAAPPISAPPTSTLPVSPTTPAPSQAANSGRGIFATPLGQTANRVKTSVDDIATLTIAPSGTGGISLSTLKITFSGTLASSTFTDADVKLVNTSNASVGTLAPVTCNSGTNCVFSWSGFGSSGLISSGSSLVLKLRIDSLTHTSPPPAGTSQALQASIMNSGDLTYSDSLDGSGATASLPDNTVPLILNVVTYASGT